MPIGIYCEKLEKKKVRTVKYLHCKSFDAMPPPGFNFVTKVVQNRIGRTKCFITMTMDKEKGNMVSRLFDTS